jgi:ankyrin repeat protein
MWAAGSGHAQTAELLLDKGADASLLDDRSKTAYQMANEAGHLEVKKLLEQRAK